MPEGGKPVCAVYCRVSSADQAADTRESLAGQRRAGEEWTKRNGYAAEFYVEPGLSGETISERPQMVRLLADVRAGKRACVAVRDLDRLSRSDYARAEIMAVCETAGALIVDVGEGKVYDPRVRSDRLLLIVRGAISDDERRALLERTSRGRVHVLKSGKQWSPPYGYRAEVGVIVVYEPEAIIYRRIVSLYVSGQPLLAIAQTLNAEGISPRRGARWRPSTLRFMLRNPAYKGERHWGEADISQSLPPLVTPQTWDRVQRQLDLQKSRRGARKREYPLVGFVWCKECGIRLSGHYSKAVRYYRCSHAPHMRRRDGIRWHSYNAERLERDVVRQLEEWCADPDAVLRPIARHYRRQQADLPELERESLRLRRALDAIPDERHAVISLRRRGIVSDRDLAAQLADIQRQDTALRQRLDEVLSRLADLRGAEGHFDAFREVSRNVSVALREPSRWRWAFTEFKVRVSVSHAVVDVTSDWLVIRSDD